MDFKLYFVNIILEQIKSIKKGLFIAIVLINKLLYNNNFKRFVGFIISQRLFDLKQKGL